MEELEKPLIKKDKKLVKCPQCHRVFQKEFTYYTVNGPTFSRNTIRNLIKILEEALQELKPEIKDDPSIR